jgi:tetratricopeptide (TPR) repeat protein
MNLKPKVWNPVYIAVMAFFLTAITAGILLFLNYRRMKKEVAAIVVLITCFVLFLFELYLTTQVANNQTWIIQVFHIALAVIPAVIQKPLYDSKLEKEEIQEASFVKPVVAGIGFVAVLLITYYGFQYLAYESMKTKLNVATQQYDAGNYSAARTILVELVNENPEYGELYYNLSFVLKQEGKLDSAKTVIMQWLEKAPSDSTARELLYELNAQSN